MLKKQCIFGYLDDVFYDDLFDDLSLKFHVLGYRIHDLALCSCINAICISGIDWVSYLLYAYIIPWISKYPKSMLSRYLYPITSHSSILVSLFVWVLIGVEILSFQCFLGCLDFIELNLDSFLWYSSTFKFFLGIIMMNFILVYIFKSIDSMYVIHRK